MSNEIGFVDSEKEIKSLIKDKIGLLRWRTREGEIVMLKDMADSHLRNTALMLMGLGYQKFMCSNKLRVLWLTALRIEWERRMAKRAIGLKEWTVQN